MEEIQERTWRSHSRIGWGNGPWDSEPDKAQWVDSKTGLDCLAVRNQYGAWCGYVGVPESHPWYNVGYNHSIDGEDRAIESRIDVHGGVTFSDSCQEEGDITASICHIPFPGRPEHVWWFGFDCNHRFDIAPDTGPSGVDQRTSIFGLLSFIIDPAKSLPSSEEEDTYRTLAYVRDQCAFLASQLANIKESLPA